jgi:hypothetical protein
MGKFIDMTGWVMKEHGVDDSRVTVIKRINDYVGSTGIHEPQWECLCECGNIFTATSKSLRKGTTRSCGCLLKESIHDRRFNDLTGQKFGRLTVLYRAEDYIDKNGRNKIMWHCRCECGNEKDIRGSNLTFGSTKSCGCLSKEGTPRIDKSLRQYDKNDNVIGKVCSYCKRMLPIDNYYKSSINADGYDGVCKYCTSHSPRGRYQVYRQAAKIRNLDFKLTLDEFDEITKQPCQYCGEYNNAYFGEQYSGIDRVNSSIGYIEGNIVPCCTMCNRMKLDYATSDWFAKMYQILKHIDYEGTINATN